MLPNGNGATNTTQSSGNHHTTNNNNNSSNHFMTGLIPQKQKPHASMSGFNNMYTESTPIINKKTPQYHNGSQGLGVLNHQ